MAYLISILDLIGTSVFAISGALAAGRKRMDIFGVVVLGCVTGLGGGTFRDVILGATPVFWVSNVHYLLVAATSALVTYGIERRFRLSADRLSYFDAVGLAVFTVIGFNKGLQSSQNYGVAIAMGVVTGVGGGVIRDVLSAEVPLILRREIYASASLSGAVLLALLSHLELPVPLAALVAALSTLAIRVAALHWNLALPIFRLREDCEKKE